MSAKTQTWAVEDENTEEMVIRTKAEEEGLFLE